MVIKIQFVIIFANQSPFTKTTLGNSCIEIIKLEKYKKHIARDTPNNIGRTIDFVVQPVIFPPVS